MDKPNCIVLNHATGMTHYGFCKDNEIIGSHTYCGKPLHGKYSIMTTYMMRVSPACKVCKTKISGSAHGNYDYSETQWGHSYR